KVDDDASHAFYLGVELARAQIAWQLRKRYRQDEELQWGCNTFRQDEASRVSHRSAALERKRKKKATP
ncbi:MAG TPA: dihydropteroate synthase, partial [Methylophilaceae bacterium]|nr:dihydropteroate synthase [Methylophilaceae bacterium]